MFSINHKTVTVALNYGEIELYPERDYIKLYKQI